MYERSFTHHDVDTCLCTRCYDDQTDNSAPLVVNTFPSWLWGASF